MRSFETISPFSWMTACGWFDYRRLQPLWHLTDAILGWLAKEHLWWMKICLRNYYRCTVQCELCQLCSSIQVESSIQVALSVALGLVMHAWSMNLCLGTVLVVNPRDKNWLMRRHFFDFEICAEVWESMAKRALLIYLIGCFQQHSRLPYLSNGGEGRLNIWSGKYERWEHFSPKHLKKAKYKFVIDHSMSRRSKQFVVSVLHRYTWYICLYTN